MFATTAVLLTTGCAMFGGGAPVLTTQSAGCSSLIPETWKTPVEAPPLPDDHTAGGLGAFADAVLGRLDIANDRTVSAIGIVSRCEARDAAAVRQATRRRILGIF